MKYKKPRKTHEQFCKDVQNIVGDEYAVVGMYERANEKIMMQHNADCNHKWNITPDNFLRGNRCPVCAPKNRKPKNKYGSKRYELVSDSFVSKMNDEDLLYFKDVLFQNLASVKNELDKRNAAQQ